MARIVQCVLKQLHFLLVLLPFLAFPSPFLPFPPPFLNLLQYVFAQPYALNARIKVVFSSSDAALRTYLLSPSLSSVFRSSRNAKA
jgi:hypothetical protein